MDAAPERGTGMPMIASLVPTLLALLVGWWLHRRGWAGSAQADALLRVMVLFGLPALILATVSGVPLTREFLFLPCIGAGLVVLMWPWSWFAARAWRPSDEGRGVVVIGPMIMNLALLYPLVLAWGAGQAVARLAMIDLGNAVAGFTLVYGLATWYGGGRGRVHAAVAAVIEFPPFWALCAALLLNALNWTLPVPLMSGLRWLGAVLVGLVFGTGMASVPSVALAIGLRLGVGAALGLLCVWWLPLDHVTGTVVLAAATAPIGFNTLVFAVRAGLPRHLAADMVSWSVLPSLLAQAWLLWHSDASAVATL